MLRRPAWCHDVLMSRRPGESAADWFERAIVNHSVAESQSEAYPWATNANPAAHEAIAKRIVEAAADLARASAAFRAERDADGGSTTP